MHTHTHTHVRTYVRTQYTHIHTHTLTTLYITTNGALDNQASLNQRMQTYKMTKAFMTCLLLNKNVHGYPPLQACLGPAHNKTYIVYVCTHTYIHTLLAQHTMQVRCTYNIIIQSVMLKPVQGWPTTSNIRVVNNTLPFLGLIFIYFGLDVHRLLLACQLMQPSTMHTLTYVTSLAIQLAGFKSSMVTYIPVTACSYMYMYHYMHVSNYPLARIHVYIHVRARRLVPLGLFSGHRLLTTTHTPQIRANPYPTLGR